MKGPSGKITKIAWEHLHSSVLSQNDPSPWQGPEEACQVHGGPWHGFESRKATASCWTSWTFAEPVAPAPISAVQGALQDHRRDMAGNLQELPRRAQRWKIANKAWFLGFCVCLLLCFSDFCPQGFLASCFFGFCYWLVGFRGFLVVCCNYCADTSKNQSNAKYQ